MDYRTIIAGILALSTALLLTGNIPLSVFQSPDIQIVGMKVYPENKSMMYVEFQNNAGQTATRDVEACVVPKWWLIKDQVLPVPWTAFPVEGRCPENRFCQTQRVTLQPYAKATYAFTPEHPSTIEDKNPCTDRIAYDTEGKYYLFVNIYDEYGGFHTRGIRPLF